MPEPETVNGKINALTRRETPGGVTFEFDLAPGDGRRERRVEWVTAPGKELREGDVLTAVGLVDSNGILHAQTLAIIPPPPKQSLPWFWIALPFVAAVAWWFVVVIIQSSGYQVAALGGAIALLYFAKKGPLQFRARVMLYVAAGTTALGALLVIVEAHALLYRVGVLIKTLMVIAAVSAGFLLFRRKFTRKASSPGH